MITIINRQRKILFDKLLIEKQLHKMLTVVGYSDFDVNILFTTNATIRSYNKQYRHKDKATDILSFPFHANVKPGQKIKIVTPDDKNLGDIIISLEYVKKVAKEIGAPFDAHLTRLLAHGTAHLLNYDHETDAQFKAMHKIESRLLNAVDIKKF